MNRFQRVQKGQTLVLMALASVVLSGMVALSVDTGNGFMHRRELQTAADAAAMAGAHLALEQVLTPPTDYAKQKSTATLFAQLNGMRASDTILIEWVDGNGTAFPNVGGLPNVGTGTVQGMKVTITANRGTFLFNLLGISTFQVAVSAMAQFGTPNGLVGAIPLALNCDGVPRAIGNGACPPSSGGPVTNYQPVLMMTQAGGPSCCTAGQTDSYGHAVPAAFVGVSTITNVFLIHDKPTDSATTALATRASAHLGLTSTLSLHTLYYVESGGTQNHNFADGLNDRIADAIANPVFNGDQPAAGKYSPVNPRVFMVAINQAASAGAGPFPGVGTLQLDEYLAFYLQFVIYDATGVTIGGYYVSPTGVPGATGFGSPTANGPKIFRLTR